MCIEFGVILSSKYKKINAETAPSNSATWDEFIEQHQQQSVKIAPYLMSE